ncbi:MAG: hypothetical protein COU98_01200 [Candidatus Staskawiczbacteria bacterium CG10_big_fil_rev_8_21_14_0_10_38_10]|uniref:PDZ domain-containing protein n=1 Tax=Candidatus Staskawiczbacteria bacterium CG10_big_fil_rev_8_21_14_0_10_38_10 TaxID=1974891 RepID=A0A2H9T1J2_9BACT|nr:MAG: hypothetical protein COU98_01200 [Candidatus Staskawiczbacteria bacterium CG10_big_fil_rev_8_21_14_0_10_38_10]
MNFNFKKVLLTVGVIFAIFIGFQSGVETGKNLVICRVCQPEDIDFSLFWQTYNVLKEKFINLEKFDNQKIIYGAISGMTKTLDDPYTVFYNPEETKEFEEQLSGTFEGVGMEIDIKNGQLIVIAPLEGTPAQKAGLRPGDKIIKINNLETFEMSVEEAIGLIRGPKGTEVTLTIIRDGWETAQDIKVIREVIKIPSLKWELIDNDIAYVRIYQFSENLNFEFRKKAIEILNSPAKKVILDLRNNPGGYLEVAQYVAGWFLEKNKTVVIEDFGQDKEKNIYRSEGNGEFYQYPTVVLINQGSASASEILAGALRDNYNAKLIGEKSFGKGSIQEQVRLEKDSSVKITVAKWLTPKGISISGVGLEPDIEVEMTDEDYQENRDPQLEKAIEFIKNL